MNDLVEQLQETVRARPQVRAVGGGSKPALSRPHAPDALPLAGLSGILEYEPSEYTFTALAATPLREVQAMLAANGQYLPFDPPLASAGATLGGTVAAGLSGPARFRYGGVRDFLLGVRLINSEGTLVYGGGRVVKNAAGFDLPKLMVGSLGQFGVLVELTFKVFPRPEASATLVVSLPDLTTALSAMQRLAASPLDLNALDLIPPSTLCLQVAGLGDALSARVARVQQFLGQTGEVLQGQAEEALWDDARDFRWSPPAGAVVKIPVTTRQIPALEDALRPFDARRRYSVGGKVAWLAWPESVPLSHLEAVLVRLGCPGLVLTGSADDPRLGAPSVNPFHKRLLSVFDPQGKFSRVTHAA